MSEQGEVIFCRRVATSFGYFEKGEPVQVAFKNTWLPGTVVEMVWQSSRKVIVDATYTDLAGKEHTTRLTVQARLVKRKEEHV